MAICLPLGPSFLKSLNSLGRDGQVVHWETLSTLRLDGHGQIEPLLQRCPNLTDLQLSTWNGFGFGDVRAFIKCLHLVPGLSSLSLSPRGDCWNDWDWGGLLAEISQIVLGLEKLNLQTKGFTYVRQAIGLRNVWFKEDPYEVTDFNSLQFKQLLMRCTLPSSLF
jgi:hypothetical protein